MNDFIYFYDSLRLCGSNICFRFSWRAWRFDLLVVGTEGRPARVADSRASRAIVTFGNGCRAQIPAAALGVDSPALRRHRDLLLERRALARRTGNGRRRADQRLETAVALLADVFEYRHGPADSRTSAARPAR